MALFAGPISGIACIIRAVQPMGVSLMAVSPY